MEDNEFHNLFLESLAKMHDAETQILESLPMMIQKASHDDLKTALADHLEQTRSHVARLEEAFEILGVDMDDKESIGMNGILQEGEEVMDMDLQAEVMDAAIIAAAQKVEHYEIGCYGTLIEWAKVMEHKEVEELLKKILKDEEAADEKLSKLAKEGINKEAFGQEN